MNKINVDSNFNGQYHEEKIDFQFPIYLVFNVHLFLISEYCFILQMTVPFTLRQRWRDRRLAGLDDTVQLAGDSYTSIWRPDLMFRSTGLTTTAKMRSNGLSVEQTTTVNRTGHVFSSMT